MSKPISQGDAQVLKWIDASRDEYTFLRDLAVWAASRNEIELALKLFSGAANFASNHHPGFFIDPLAENTILQIGQSLERGSPPQANPEYRRPSESQRSLLHVVSEVWEVGGLTRTIINWIRADRATSHSVILLRQRDAKGLAWFRREIDSCGVHVQSLNPDSSLVSRALELRRFAERGFSACIVHVGQADVAPIVAFASPNVPPVAYIDHADHSFWLGLSVADLVIHQRPIGADLCSTRRTARKCHVLPIPLNEFCHTTTRDACRQQLGIDQESVLALTVGRTLKYRPTEDKNFFRTALELTKAHRNLVIHFVGVERAQAEAWAGRSLPENQMRFHGERAVSADLYIAADLYLESFPFGSQTAVLEAALAGLATVRAPGNGTMLLATSDTAIDAFLNVPQDEQQFVEMARQLIVDGSYRRQIANQLQAAVAAAHTGSGWRCHLDDLHRCLHGLEHLPHTLAFVPNRIDDVDVGLQRWHRDSGNYKNADADLRVSAKWYVNDAMRWQMAQTGHGLLPNLAVRALFKGHGDRTILGMGLSALLRRPKTQVDK